MVTQEQLEAKVRSFYPADQHPNDCIDVLTLTDDQLYALLAWEFWKDGMDWKLVPNVCMGKNPMYKTREDVLHVLKIVFAY